jgi:hypothetical protein
VPGLTEEPAWPTLRTRLFPLAASGIDRVDSYSRLDARELASADDRAAVVDWQVDETSSRDAGFGPVHWLSAIPTPAPTPGLDPYLFSPDVLRRPPTHTGGKSWGLMLRNRTWDARRATVGPHLAAISGQRRSLRASPTAVCSTVHAGRGILPSWPCEFDSRHPLHIKRPSRRAFLSCNQALSPWQYGSGHNAGH